jgi:hypothetical protein
MEAINLRESLIESINTLPSNMLEEVNKFLSFLKYENSTEQNTTDSALNSYMQTEQFQKDRASLHCTYEDVINDRATLLSEDEYTKKMDSFVADLKLKLA